MDLFFFYGTLMEEAVLREVLGPVPFRVIGSGAVVGRLYDAGSYPALTLPGSRTIPGRLVEIAPGGAARLDAFEGVPEGLYSRQPVCVQTDGSQRTAWTFLYRRAVVGMPEIASWPDPLRRTP